MIFELHKNIVKNSFLLDKYSLARLISLFEDERLESLELKKELYTYIQSEKEATSFKTKLGFIVGWTGMPGVGKSSLLNSICLNILDNYQNISIAVLAIDPSSSISGGSILGDRTRTKFPTKNNRIFFRSQATEMAFGGLSRTTFSVARLLRNFFDFVFIETVGVGQNEIEIKSLADYVFLVLQPLSGDEIQFIKSGIMEIPDFFIINKAEQTHLAQISLSKLKNILGLLPKDTKNNIRENPIFLTSNITQIGIEELVSTIISKQDKINVETEQNRNLYFFKKYITEMYGTFGLSTLSKNNFIYNHNISYDNNVIIALQCINFVIKK